MTQCSCNMQVHLFEYVDIIALACSFCKLDSCAVCDLPGLLQRCKDLTESWALGRPMKTTTLRHANQFYTNRTPTEHNRHMMHDLYQCIVCGVDIPKKKMDNLLFFRKPLFTFWHSCHNYAATSKEVFINNLIDVLNDC